MHEYLQKDERGVSGLSNTKNQISMGTTIRNIVERSEERYCERTPQATETRKKEKQQKVKVKVKIKGNPSKK